MARTDYQLINKVTVMAIIFFSQISPLLADSQVSALKEKTIPIIKTSPMDKSPEGMSMSGMMKGPQTTELYPTMISNSEFTQKEQEKMKRESILWLTEGIAIVTEGNSELTKASKLADVKAIRHASNKINAGLTLINSGISTNAALNRGKPSQEIALEWFKSQLNLTEKPVVTQQVRFLGMAPFNLFICLLMIVSIGVSLGIYILRMRRAHHLQERISSGNNIDSESSLQDNDAGSLDTTNAHEGLLPIQRKKLCRLRVARIYPETPDVRTFRFVSCDHGPIPFSYLPGQFLTFTLPIESGKVKRSYTISSSPTQGYYCEITVKREQYGVGSRYLHDVLQEGDTLDVRGPSGKLTFTGKKSESIVLIGGGVGITPLMSVTRALTDMGWKGEIILIACCTDPDHFIFGAEIERLKKRNVNLRVYVTMSLLQEDFLDYHRGRISKEYLLDWIPDIATRTLIHICASPNFMSAIKSMLADIGVPSDYIKTESFGSLEKPHSREDALGKQKSDRPETTINFQKSAITTTTEGDETILEAAERVGVDMNYSCRVGSCGECAVKVISGDVEMETEDALEPNDKAANIILACQARPTSNVIVKA